MSDARLRELERRWRESGRDEDRAAWLAECARAGCPYRFGEVVTRAPALHAVCEGVAALADRATPLVLFGEPGSGRQALAEAAHAAGSRRAEPFMLSSGVGSSPTYQELEVLGYLRHTFINSIQNEPGVLERAEDGTALIRLGDDAAPGLLQTLAEAIANGWLRRVGCTVERPARARLILAVETATPDLVAFVRVTQAAVFRVPPLRERLEDLPLLIPALTPGLTRVGARRLERLAAHTWPGNLPELQSVLARIATRASTADPALGAGP